MNFTSLRKDIETGVVVVSYLLIILIVPIVLLSQFLPFYWWRFESYDVYANFSAETSMVEVQEKFAEIAEFIRPPFTSTLDNQFFSTEDILHMQDVRAVFQFLYLLLLATSIVVLFKFISEKSLLRIYNLKIYLKYVYQSLIAILGVMLIILVASLVWWEQIFVAFHRILFPMNEYWVLDPQTSNLIKYFDNLIFLELLVIYGIILLVITFILRKLVGRT